jgi:hypothetical protein
LFINYSSGHLEGESVSKKAKCFALFWSAAFIYTSTDFSKHRKEEVDRKSSLGIHLCTYMLIYFLRRSCLSFISPRPDLETWMLEDRSLKLNMLSQISLTGLNHLAHLAMLG